MRSGFSGIRRFSGIFGDFPGILVPFGSLSLAFGVVWTI
jgi:hypothetical protein